MDADELKANFAALPNILPTTTWNQHRLSLRDHVARHDIARFTRWSTLQATMFVGEAPYVEQELLELMTHRDTWEPALIESDVGDPQRLSYALWTSGNLVHQAYHLKQWLDKARADVRDLQWIVELGGGYGALAKVIHQLGFNGVYTLVDFPEFLLLQEYYLTAHGIDAEYVSANGTEYQAGTPDLFVALFSLSEANRADRLPLVPQARSYLFAYQPEWEGTSNTAWFEVLTQVRPMGRWWDWEAGPNPVYRYAVGI